jgi:hypothetical protein
MPILNFGTSTATLASETDLTLVALARSLGKIPTLCQSSVNVSLLGMVRSTIGLISEGTFSWSADLKRMLKLGIAQAACQSEAIIQFFLSAVATAPPIGALSVPSVNQLLNPQFVAPGLGGARFVRGTLISLAFKIQGQRLTGLNAQFTACRTDQAIGSPHDITKTAPSSIIQTAPVMDTATGVETMTGNFAINPSDTAGLPNSEIEFIYELTLSDGLGRVYSLESGKFRIYSVC